MFLLIPRRRRAASFFGALATLNLGVIFPLYLGSTPQPSSGEPPIRAMLINVNTKSGKAASVAAALRRFNPDIIVIEEVNTKWLSELSPVLANYSHSQVEPREDNFASSVVGRLECLTLEFAFQAPAP
ncbi:MAG: hypothetical protein KKD14_08955 [Verrucomicrobia bacterium]|nr:hypothetical protein [Verrucomicrobiota bacterium]MBU4248478.1 hypothetical protein [Verrucomicrobiota bacterium]MBU4291575.1 hypothetical protein [Verrucomicrobiota bacterium]